MSKLNRLSWEQQHKLVNHVEYHKDTYDGKVAYKEVVKAIAAAYGFTPSISSVAKAFVMFKIKPSGSGHVGGSKLTLKDELDALRLRIEVLEALVKHLHVSSGK